MQMQRVVAAAVALWFIFVMVALKTVDGDQLCPDATEEEGLVVEVLNAILGAAKERDYCTLFITQNYSFGGVSEVAAPWGVGVFKVAARDQDANVTHAQLSQVVDQAGFIRRTSRSILVVVMSDDPAFLVAFAEWLFKGRLKVWSTRFLVLTHHPLNRLPHLRSTLAKTNSMLIIINHEPSPRCSMLVELPYSSEDSQPQKVAWWTPSRGLAPTFRLPLFPDKFYRLATGPRLLVGMVPLAVFNKTKVVDDPDAPGGKRVIFLIPRARMLETVSDAMNFTYDYVTPADRAWGVEQPDGSWTGMIGMAMRQEVDISLGLIDITAARAKVVDFTFPVDIMYNRMIVGRGKPEVNPWSFLLPLGRHVWAALLMALVGVLAVMTILPSCLQTQTRHYTGLMVKASSCVRVLLQQDVSPVRTWWVWERVLLGVWMLTTMVLTRSYAGNLVSLLAVRRIPMPIQSLRDVVDNPITFLVKKGTVQAYTIQTAESGVLRDIYNLQKEGRFQTFTSSEVGENLDVKVRRGDHTLMAVVELTKTKMAQDFSVTGKCDFYLAREEFITSMGAMAGPKNNPLINAVSRRIITVIEAGIYNHWLNSYTPNMTTCLNPPTTMAVRSPLSLSNIWGTLVVYVAGLAISFHVFCFELVYSHLR